MNHPEEFKTGDGWTVPVEEAMKDDFDKQFDKQFDRIEKIHKTIFQMSGIVFVLYILLMLAALTALLLLAAYLWQHVHFS
jgi:hypothetical protein